MMKKWARPNTRHRLCRNDPGRSAESKHTSSAPVSNALLSLRAAIEDEVYEAMRERFSEREHQLAHRESQISHRELQLQERERDVAEKELALKTKPPMVQHLVDPQMNRVRLNIRGTRYEVSKASLLHEEGTLFSILSIGRWTPDLDGSYFIDREPVYAIPLLEYLVAMADPGCTRSAGQLRRRCLAHAENRGLNFGHHDSWREALDEEVRYYGVQSLRHDLLYRMTVELPGGSVSLRSLSWDPSSCENINSVEDMAMIEYRVENKTFAPRRREGLSGCPCEGYMYGMLVDQTFEIGAVHVWSIRAHGMIADYGWNAVAFGLFDPSTRTQVVFEKSQDFAKHDAAVVTGVLDAITGRLCIYSDGELYKTLDVPLVPLIAAVWSDYNYCMSTIVDPLSVSTPEVPSDCSLYVYK